MTKGDAQARPEPVELNLLLLYPYLEVADLLQLETEELLPLLGQCEGPGVGMHMGVRKRKCSRQRADSIRKRGQLMLSSCVHTSAKCTSS